MNFSLKYTKLILLNKNNIKATFSYFSRHLSMYSTIFISSDFELMPK